MLETLDVRMWDEGTVFYKASGEKKKKAFHVWFVPRTGKKIGVYRHTQERSCFFWYDRTRQRWIRYWTLYSLHRALHHMVWGIAMEQSVLMDMLNALHDVDIKLHILRDLTPQAIGALRKKVHSQVDILANAQNERKIEAHEQLEWVFCFKDSRGRRNVSVLITRNLAARTRIEKRLEETGGINAAVAQHLGIVKRLLWCSEYLVDCALKSIRALPTLSAKRITMVWSDVAQLTLPPFSANRRFICLELEEAIRLFNLPTPGRGEEASPEFSTRHEHARALIERARDSLHLKQIRARLERGVLLPVAESEDNGSMDDTSRGKILRVVTQCFNELNGVRENGFVHPVRHRAQQHLTAAIRLLRDSGVRDRAEIKTMKEELKQGIEML